MMRTSTVRATSPPTGVNCFSCTNAEQLRLQVERQLADLVEEERAAVGLGEAAGLARVRPR